MYRVCLADLTDDSRIMKEIIYEEREVIYVKQYDNQKVDGKSEDGDIIFILSLVFRRFYVGSWVVGDVMD